MKLFMSQSYASFCAKLDRNCGSLITCCPCPRKLQYAVRDSSGNTDLNRKNGERPWKRDQEAEDVNVPKKQ